jgi:hypothetical protein
LHSCRPDEPIIKSADPHCGQSQSQYSQHDRDALLMGLLPIVSLTNKATLPCGLFESSHFQHYLAWKVPAPPA